VSNSVLLTASGWKSPELLTQGDVVYLDSAAGGGNDPVEVQEVTSRRSSQAEAAGVRNTVFVAAVLQQVRVRPTHAHAHTVKPVPSLQLPFPSPPPPLHVPASRTSPLHACPRFTHVPASRMSPRNRPPPPAPPLSRCAPTVVVAAPVGRAAAALDMHGPPSGPASTPRTSCQWT
jgi:hypothetical protein